MTEMGEGMYRAPDIDPDDDICEMLAKKIDELINRNKKNHGNSGTHGLKHRYSEQITGNFGPGSTGWDNHEAQIKNQQKALTKALKKYEENNCGDPPSGSWSWATRPVPLPSEYRGNNIGMEALETSAKAVGSLAVGYAIYRLIRFLPSLIPPAWPTIPVNLAIP